MKKIIGLVYVVLLLLLACKGNDTPDHPETVAFTVEIVASNDAPVMRELVSFYIKSNAASAIKTVVWDWNDGAAATGMTAQHSFATEKTFHISVTAVGNDESVVKATKDITVAGRSLSTALKRFDSNRVWICAHRCNTDNTTIPENSIAALNRCIALSDKIDLVEIDPRVTKDGVIVVMHDETVNRTTNGTGSVADLTYNQIRGLRLKLPNGTVTQDTVPTLRAFLLAAKDKMWIDLDFIDRIPSYVYELYNVVKECGMLDQVIFYTSNNATAISSLLTYSPPGIPFTYMNKESDAANYKGMGVYVTQISAANALNTSLVTTAVANQLVTFSNTLVQNGITIDNDIKSGDFSGVDNMLGKGLNIFQTDQAAILDTYFRTKNKR
jgi:glycerophosphoryl diester phosphodiesterase